MEKMYHPVSLRTTYCRHGSACPFQAICAHAHSSEDLRDRTKTEREYEQDQWESVREQPLLAAFLPERKRRDFTSEFGTLWRDVPMQTSSAFLELSGSQLFLVNRLESLFYEIQEFALEEGLQCVIKRRQAGRQGLFLKGLHVETIVSGVKAMLESPSNHFVLEERHYIDRVIDSIGELI